MNKEARIKTLALAAWAHWKRLELNRAGAEKVPGKNYPWGDEVRKSELAFLESIEAVLVELKRLEAENAELKKRVEFHLATLRRAETEHEALQSKLDVAVKALEECRIRLSGNGSSLIGEVIEPALAQIQGEKL